MQLICGTWYLFFCTYLVNTATQNMLTWIINMQGGQVEVHHNPHKSKYDIHPGQYWTSSNQKWKWLHISVLQHTDFTLKINCMYMECNLNEIPYYVNLALCCCAVFVYLICSDYFSMLVLFFRIYSPVFKGFFKNLFLKEIDTCGSIPLLWKFTTSSARS